jgi:rare lipoprotein A (peptidoglycan hydrolase)
MPFVKVLPYAPGTLPDHSIVPPWFLFSIICLAVPLLHGCAVLERTAESSAATDTTPNSPSVALKPSTEAQPPASPSPPAKEKPSAQTKWPQTGEASWYGPRFQGKTTASGGTFHQEGFTAAHASLPFGSKVKVTNLANGKSVEVKINDRGPFIENRIIDVSRAAAKALEMKKSGTTTVRVELLAGQ